MNTVKAVFESDFGCFTQPSNKVERFSYPFINPSAARGCLEAILWKPEFRYYVRKISVLKPIEFVNVKVNEVESVATLKHPVINTDQVRTQRNQNILVNPAYIIEAEIVLTNMGQEGRDSHDGPNSVIKYTEMFNRRLKNGQSYHQPCFGHAHFPADFRTVNEETDIAYPIRQLEERMIYDIFNLDKNEKQLVLTYFDAKCIRGVIEVPHWNDIKSMNGVK